MTFRALQVYTGRCPKNLESIRRIVERKLEMLDAAGCLDDLRSPPGNRLKALSGDLKDHYSLRINDQYRLCFRWESGEAHDVDIVDYH